LSGLKQISSQLLLGYLGSKNKEINENKNFHFSEKKPTFTIVVIGRIWSVSTVDVLL